MKAWLKGGLIGVGISLVIEIVYIIYYATTCSGESCMGLILFASIYGVLIFLGLLLLGFILGASAGLIIDLLGVKHLFLSVLTGFIFIILSYLFVVILEGLILPMFGGFNFHNINLPFKTNLFMFTEYNEIIPLFFIGYILYPIIIYIIIKVRNRAKVSKK